MAKFERIRDKAQDVLWGAGIAEIATSVYVQEDKLALAGIALMVGSMLVEPRGGQNNGRD